MEIPIFCNGKQYISSGRAARMTGYTSDYIGQLCRAGKIPGKLVGRTWYVELEVLKEHRATRQLGKPKQIELSERADESEIVVVNETTSLCVDAARSLPSLNFKYSSDESDLLPSLKGRGFKKYSLAVGRKPKRFVVATTSLVLASFIGMLVLNQRSAPNTYSIISKSEVAGDISKVGNSNLNSLASLIYVWENLKSVALGQGYQNSLGDSVGVNAPLSREEIRAILLGNEALLNEDSSKTSEIVEQSEDVKPAANPFGMPQ